MDVEKRGDQRWHFALGPVERWIVVVVAGAFVAGGWFGVDWFVESQKSQVAAQAKQGEKIQELVTQQAVANGTLATISAQLTDVPQLRSDVVELKVRVESLEEGQKELRNTRGLR